MTYLVAFSEGDLELVMEALRLLSLQRLLGDDAEKAGLMAQELEELKKRQDAA